MKKDTENLFKEENGVNYVEIRPYTLSDLAKIYGLSRPTMRNWLDPFTEVIGERKGYFYSIRQVRIIFEHLELPSSIKLRNDMKPTPDTKNKDKVYAKVYNIGKLGRGGYDFPDV